MALYRLVEEQWEAEVAKTNRTKLVERKKQLLKVEKHRKEKLYKKLMEKEKEQKNSDANDADTANSSGAATSSFSHSTPLSLPPDPLLDGLKTELAEMDEWGDVFPRRKKEKKKKEHNESGIQQEEQEKGKERDSDDDESDPDRFVMDEDNDEMADELNVLRNRQFLGCPCEDSCAAPQKLVQPSSSFPSKEELEDLDDSEDRNGLEAMVAEMENEDIMYSTTALGEVVGDADLIMGKEHKSTETKSHNEHTQPSKKVKHSEKRIEASAPISDVDREQDLGEDDDDVNIFVKGRSLVPLNLSRGRPVQSLSTSTPTKPATRIPLPFGSTDHNQPRAHKQTYSSNGRVRVREGHSAHGNKNNETKSNSKAPPSASIRKFFYA